MRLVGRSSPPFANRDRVRDDNKAAFWLLPEIRDRAAAVTRCRSGERRSRGLPHFKDGGVNPPHMKDLAKVL